MVDIDKQLERVLKVAVAGWGDSVLIGFLAVYLKKIVPDEMAEYIQNGTRLTSRFTESQMRKFRRIGQAIHIESITAEEILRVLKEEAPSAYVTLQFHPKGIDWLNSEVADIKKTLAS